MKFIVYDTTGRILRAGNCSAQDFFLQAEDGEFVMEGSASDISQKVVNVGIKSKIVDKTPMEIKADNPTLIEIPEGKRPANITNEQWRDILNRLSKLETEA